MTGAKSKSSDQITAVDALPERSQAILRLLIEEYIRDGLPVGSKTLAQLPGIRVSAATVRNVMGDLESLGFLVSPHTSAGRVPTSQAYRMFVDSMLQVQPLDMVSIDQIKSQLDPMLNREGLIKQASDYLSGLTQMTSLVVLPPRESVQLRQIEFMRLSDNRLLVILISDDLEVQNRVIEVDREYTESQLTEAANFINQHFAGQSLPDVRSKLREELVIARDNMQLCLENMLCAVNTVLDETTQKETDKNLLVSGQSNLMGHGELGDVDKIKELFEALNRKSEVYDLLQRSLEADGMQVFIGQESGYRIFDDCSVVTSTYRVDGSAVGVLGVIGPTRMAYDRVIPVVDVTSKLLAAALNNPK